MLVLSLVCGELFGQDHHTPISECVKHFETTFITKNPPFTLF